MDYQSLSLSLFLSQDCSRNGTFVGGHLLGMGNKRILRTNDVISIINGEYRLFVFHDMKADLSQSLPKIITSKYFVGAELGSGACGVVRLVHDVVSCQEFAMKQVVKMRLEDPGQKIINDPERIMNEVAIMKSLEHVSAECWRPLSHCCDSLFRCPPFIVDHLSKQVYSAAVLCTGFALSLTLLVHSLTHSLNLHHHRLRGKERTEGGEDKREAFKDLLLHNCAFIH